MIILYIIVCICCVYVNLKLLILKTLLNVTIFTKALFVCVWLHRVFLAVCGLSLVAVSRSTLLTVHALLFVVASLADGHGL